MTENIGSELLSHAERITRTEQSLASIAKTLEVILQNQRVERELLAEKPLPSISNPPSETSENLRHYPEPRHEQAPVPHAGARHLKPASPNDFSGDRTKGRAFLNSCELYINLVPHQFADDHAKIMWAFSFMKSDRAARFVDRQMRNYQEVGGLPYSTWSEFVQEFVGEFCPKNEILTARTDLETSRYHQGTKTVDEYVDDFREMIGRARYLEGSHIVLKFRQGLNPKIQDYVACLTSGRPSDENPHEWYAAAILCDENRIANEAFRASSRTIPRSETSSSTNSIFRRIPVRAANTAPPISRYAPPVASTSNPSQTSASTPVRPAGTTSLVCYRCGQTGHLRPDCPKRFDVRYMDFEEKQAFAQDALAELDVVEAADKHVELAEETKSGFGLDSE